MSYAPANFSGNHGSPYQATSIYSPKSLLQNGFIPISPQYPQEQELCAKLHQIVENIKIFFWNRFQTVGLDSEGKIPPFFVHLPNENAYYHPKTLEYPEIFNFNDKYAIQPEIVCHEFTHGVIQNLNPLGNKGQAGAINESLADVVAIVFKRHIYMIKDWKMGNLRDLREANYKSSDNITRSKTIKDIRNLNQNENDNQENDYGYTHDNSNFLSHAFYHASLNLSKSNADNEDKLLLEVWWKSVVELEDKSFAGFINKTLEVSNSHKYMHTRGAIKQAWEQVGVLFE